MTTPRFDQDFWEQLWSKTLSEQADKVARRPPNAHLMAEAASLPPGRALDANAWESVVAEERVRAVTGTGVDAVVCARRC